MKRYIYDRDVIDFYKKSTKTVRQVLGIRFPLFKRGCMVIDDENYATAIRLFITFHTAGGKLTLKKKPLTS
jgi:hypothetical protein